MKLTWKRLLKFLSSAIGWSLMAIIILVTVLYLYIFPWTGFGDYTTPTRDFVRGKTLWDWMELLIIPLILGLGVYALNRSERKTESEIARDRQQEAALQSYLDRMTELLLKEKLRTARNKEVRNVARIRTLTVLQGLNATRKGLIVRFLHEAGLINQDNPIVNLTYANLSGADLRGANLRGANLSGANLEGANLEKINLLVIFANITEMSVSATDEMGSPLKTLDASRGTNLSRANLSHASLSSADLNGSILSNADVSGADLRGAQISSQRLTTAKLKGAIMPDGTKHE